MIVPAWALRWVTDPDAWFVQACVAYLGVLGYFAGLTLATWADLVWKVRQLYLGQAPAYADVITEGGARWPATDVQRFVEEWKALLDTRVAGGRVSDDGMNWFLRAVGARLAAVNAYQ